MSYKRCQRQSASPKLPTDQLFNRPTIFFCFHNSFYPGLLPHFFSLSPRLYVTPTSPVAIFIYFLQCFTVVSFLFLITTCLLTTSGTLAPSQQSASKSPLSLVHGHRHGLTALDPRLTDLDLRLGRPDTDRQPPSGASRDQPRSRCGLGTPEIREKGKCVTETPIVPPGPSSPRSRSEVRPSVAETIREPDVARSGRRKGMEGASTEGKGRRRDVVNKERH